MRRAYWAIQVHAFRQFHQANSLMSVSAATKHFCTQRPQIKLAALRSYIYAGDTFNDLPARHQEVEKLVAAYEKELSVLREFQRTDPDNTRTLITLDQLQLRLDALQQELALLDQYAALDQE